MKLKEINETIITIESYKDLHPLLEFYQKEMLKLWKNSYGINREKYSKARNLAESFLVICESIDMFKDFYPTNCSIDIEHSQIYKELLKNTQFKEIYCKKTQKIYWILGNISDNGILFRDLEMYVASYSAIYDIQFKNIFIDILTDSTKFKNSKYISYTSNIDSNIDITKLNSKVLEVESFDDYVK